MKNDNETPKDRRYEARKAKALNFVNRLRSLGPSERQVLRYTERSEAEAAKLVVAHLGRFGRLDGSVTGQVNEIRKLSAVIRLWAGHDKDDGQGTIGAAIGQSCGNSRHIDSAESLLHQALSCETVFDLLDDVMPLVVARLKQSGIALNWVRFLMDLDDWSLPTREIQARWARDFYVSTKAKRATASA